MNYRQIVANSYSYHICFIIILDSGSLLPSVLDVALRLVDALIVDEHAVDGCCRQSLH